VNPRRHTKPEFVATSTLIHRRLFYRSRAVTCIAVTVSGSQRQLGTRLQRSFLRTEMTTGAPDSCHGTGSLNKSDRCDQAGRCSRWGFEGHGMTRVRKVDSEVPRAPGFRKLKEPCVF